MAPRLRPGAVHWVPLQRLLLQPPLLPPPLPPPRSPLHSPPSCADHALAPFALHSSVRVLDASAYYDAVVCAIEHSRTVALQHAGKGKEKERDGAAAAAGRPSEPVYAPRGFQWSVAEVSRRSRVRPEEEWAYFVHYAGWNKRFDEWVVGALLKPTTEGSAAAADQPNQLDQAAHSAQRSSSNASASVRGKRGRGRGAAVAFVTPHKERSKTSLANASEGEPSKTKFKSKGRSQRL